MADVYSLATSSSHDYYGTITASGSAQTHLGDFYYYTPSPRSHSGTRTCDRCSSQSQFQSQPQFSVQPDPYQLYSSARAPTQQRSSIRSTSTSTATTTTALGRLASGWNIFNTVITLVLAATALAIGVAYGMTSANQNQQNLKLTIWRDCIDLADLLGNSTVCRTLQAEGFDTIANLHRRDLDELTFVDS